MSDAISKASVCEILADIYPTDGEKVVAVKEVDKAYEAIQQLPSAQPEIIRCKDCRYLIDEGDGYTCDNSKGWVVGTDTCFGCVYAERRTDE